MLKIKRNKQKICTLPLKSGVVVAAASDFMSSKAPTRDFPMKYIHGIKVIDTPRKEFYLISSLAEITSDDFITQPDAFEWAERKQLLTVKEMNAIRRDKREHRLVTKKNALLSDFDLLKGRKK